MFFFCFFSESFSSNYNKLQNYRFLYFKIYIFLYHFCLCKLNKKDKQTILPFFVCAILRHFYYNVVGKITVLKG